MSTVNQVSKLLNKKFPQNYLISNSYLGTLIITIFLFGFLLLYKPLNVHESGNLNFYQTMAIYCITTGIASFFIINLLKKIKHFADPDSWNFAKELSAIFIILLGIGIAIYFIAFAIESPSNRWNFSTFFNSLSYSFLIGILPFAFFTALNYRYLTQKNNFIVRSEKIKEEKIHITSKLKKEDLSFFSQQLLFATSEGNYVVFYLLLDNKLEKKTIRNSINSIEKQVAHVSTIVRIHRAFIVNIKKVQQKRGNSLGYNLRLTDTDTNIPVSRKNIQKFDQLYAKYKTH